MRPGFLTYSVTEGRGSVLGDYDRGFMSAHHVICNPSSILLWQDW